MTVPTSAQVLRLITRLNVGGPARQALLLSGGLGPAFPTVLAAGRPSSVEGELGDPAVPVHRVPLVRPLSPTADCHALVAVRRLLVHSGAALLHTHMAKAGAVGRLAAHTVRPRPLTVHTFHGHVLEGYFSPLFERGLVETERRLARRTDALVAVAPQVRDALLDLGIGRPEQFHLIPLGLDLEAFRAVSGPTGALRRHIGVPPGAPLVGAAGRLVPIKDVATLLDAVRLLPAVHLAVLGDGELRPALEERCRHLRISERVHFTGWWADMPAAMADLDVVALTSRNEGTPVSLIEALAAGRPVVATDVGGVRFVVRDGVTGCLAPAGDAVGIAGLLERLLADPLLRRRMGERGRRDVCRRFGKAGLLEGIRQLYGELLARRGQA